MVVHIGVSLSRQFTPSRPVLVSVKSFSEHLCFRAGLSRRHVELVLLYIHEDQCSNITFLPKLQPEERNMLFVSGGRKRTPARSAAEGSKRLCTICLSILATVAFCCCHHDDLCYVNMLIHAGVSFQAQPSSAECLKLTATVEHSMAFYAWSKLQTAASAAGRYTFLLQAAEQLATPDVWSGLQLNTLDALTSFMALPLTETVSEDSHPLVASQDSCTASLSAARPILRLLQSCSSVGQQPSSMSTDADARRQTSLANFPRICQPKMDPSHTGTVASHAMYIQKMCSALVLLKTASLVSAIKDTGTDQEGTATMLLWAAIVPCIQWMTSYPKEASYHPVTVEQICLEIQSGAYPI